MKIALLQINPTVGDLAGNARLIRGRRRGGRTRSGADLAVTPELALVGYLPRDLLLSPGFVQPQLGRRSRRSRATLADGPPVLVGLPEPNPSDEGRPLFNTAVLLRGGRIEPALPQGAAADLRRLRRGPLLRAVPRTRRCSTIGGRRLGISICEDVWNDRDFWKRRRYHSRSDRGARSPRAPMRSSTSRRRRSRPASTHAARRDARQHGAPSTSVPVAVRQPVRRQRRPRLRRPQLARSTPTGALIARGRAFAADVVIVDLDAAHAARSRRRTCAAEAEIWRRARARHARLRAQVRLLVASCSACPAASTRRSPPRSPPKRVGAGNVLGVLMPSPYSSQGSVDDSLRARRATSASPR